MTVKQIISNFGEPATAKNITTIFTPYPLIYNNKPVSKLQIHKLAAPSLTKVLNEILDVYGLSDINELGINQYGGTYNNRPMRGTEDRYEALIKAGNKEDAYNFLSLHSWGLAIDLDPARNSLKETSKTARFARPEYKVMIDIFYKHGWYSLGVEKNYDWMHFQFIKP